MLLPTTACLPLGPDSSCLDWLVLAGIDHERVLKPESKQYSPDYHPPDPLPANRLPYRVRYEANLETLRHEKYTSLLLHPATPELAPLLATPLSSLAGSMNAIGLYGVLQEQMATTAKAEERNYDFVLSLICRVVVYLAGQVDPKLQRVPSDSDSEPDPGSPSSDVARVVAGLLTSGVRTDTTLFRGLQPVACINVVEHSVGKYHLPALVSAVKGYGSKGDLVEHRGAIGKAMLSKLCVAMTAPLSNDPPGPPARLGVLTDTVNYIVVQLAFGTEGRPELFLSPCMPITSRAPSLITTLILSLLWNEPLDLPDQLELPQPSVLVRSIGRIRQRSSEPGQISIVETIGTDGAVGAASARTMVTLDELYSAPHLIVRFDLYPTGDTGLHALVSVNPSLPAHTASPTPPNPLPPPPPPPHVSDPPNASKTNSADALSHINSDGRSFTLDRDYVPLLTLTSGPFYGKTGVVYGAQLNSGSKIVIKYSLAGRESDLDHEAGMYQDVLAGLREEIVPRYCGLFAGGFGEPRSGGERIALVLEHCGDPVENFGTLAAGASLTLYRQLEALHKHGIIHNDFAPRNVLIDAAGHTTIIHFSHANGGHHCIGNACEELASAHLLLQVDLGPVPAGVPHSSGEMWRSGAEEGVGEQEVVASLKQGVVMSLPIGSMRLTMEQLASLPTFLVRFVFRGTHEVVGLHAIHRQTSLPPPPSQPAYNTTSSDRPSHSDGTEQNAQSTPFPVPHSDFMPFLTFTGGDWSETAVVYQGQLSSGAKIMIKYSQAGFQDKLVREARIYQHVLLGLEGVVPRFLGYFVGGYSERGSERVAILVEHCGSPLKAYSDLSPSASIYLYGQLVMLHEYGVIHRAFGVPRTVGIDAAGHTTIIDLSRAQAGHQCVGSACKELAYARSLLQIGDDGSSKQELVKNAY